MTDDNGRPLISIDLSAPPADTGRLLALLLALAEESGRTEGRGQADASGLDGQAVDRADDARPTTKDSCG
jgi:hypothetical protein